MFGLLVTIRLFFDPVFLRALLRISSSESPSELSLSSMESLLVLFLKIRCFF